MRSIDARKKVIVNLFSFPLFIFLISISSCKGPKSEVTDEPASDTTSVVEAPPVNGNEFLLTDQQAGRFRITEELPGPAALTNYQVRVEQMTFGRDEVPFEEAVTIISDHDEDLLWLKTNTDIKDVKQIREIIVVSPRFRTSKNIGVGSTLNDFINAYPGAKIWYTYVSDMYVAETTEVKAQFLLDEKDYLKSKPKITSEITPLSITDFSGDAKFIRVRLF